MNKGQQSAFPTRAMNDSGLTKREYFAVMAMQGILAASGNNPNLNQGGDFNTRHIVRQAITAADDLLKALES